MGVGVSWNKLRAGDKPTSLHFELSLRAEEKQIGRASCRERV